MNSTSLTTYHFSHTYGDKLGSYKAEDKQDAVAMMVKAHDLEDADDYLDGIKIVSIEDYDAYDIADFVHDGMLGNGNVTVYSWIEDQSGLGGAARHAIEIYSEGAPFEELLTARDIDRDEVVQELKPLIAKTSISEIVDGIEQSQDLEELRDALDKHSEIRAMLIAADVECDLYDLSELETFGGEPVDGAISWDDDGVLRVDDGKFFIEPRA